MITIYTHHCGFLYCITKTIKLFRKGTMIFWIYQIFGHEKGLGDLFLRGLCEDYRCSANRVGEALPTPITP